MGTLCYVNFKSYLLSTHPRVNREVLFIELSFKVQSGGYFLILLGLTTSKMRKFQTIKLSQFHKAKTCWTKNSWSSATFEGNFFMFWGAKKFLLNIVASALKSCKK